MAVNWIGGSVPLLQPSLVLSMRVRVASGAQLSYESDAMFAGGRRKLGPQRSAHVPPLGSPSFSKYSPPAVITPNRSLAMFEPSPIAAAVTTIGLFGGPYSKIQLPPRLPRLTLK